MLREVALLRLAAQRLAGPGKASPAEALRWMTAVQAQDLRGALAPVALRTAGDTSASVRAALDAGPVVRSWPMRGTPHLVAAEDLPWMLQVLAPRVVAASTARRTQLGLDEQQVEHARASTQPVLAGGGRVRRADRFTTWKRAGLDPAGQRGTHVLRVLATTGTVVLGPTDGGEQLLVLTEEWIPHPREPQREEALGELALRYFASHGPAQVTDFARWAGLVAADVRTGLALARPALECLDVDGVEHLMDPRTPGLLGQVRTCAEGVFLPGFDEHLLGYSDRRAVLDPEFAERTVPGGNGVFRPTVVDAGRVVGTWQVTGRGSARTITTTPFTTHVAQAVPQVFSTLP